MRLDPWASTTFKDYARLREQFGLEEFDAHRFLPGVPHHRLFTRGVVFAQRGYGGFGRALVEKRPCAVMSGLMPSGNMHLGHKMLLDQMIHYQTLGADIFVAVADLESLATRGQSLEEGRKLALEEYIASYIALGLEPEGCQVYFQSQRSAVQKLGYVLGGKVNLSTMQAVYGFEGSTSLAHINAPLIQAGDILHPQLAEYGGPRPTLIPVGVDQDPHIRLTRNLAQASRLIHAIETSDGRIGVFAKSDDNVAEMLKAAGDAVHAMGFEKLELKASYKALYVNDAGPGDVERLDEALTGVDADFDGYGFHAPAGSFHRLMVGLTGEKMSSSKPETALFLSDEPVVVKKKLMAAKTGGGVTVEEHRERGGNPGDCAVYELHAYHLLDDKELEEVYNGCRAGELLCGNCKKLAVERLNVFLEDFREKKGQAMERLGEYVRED